MTEYLDRETDLTRDDVVAAIDEASYWSSLAARLMFRWLPLGRDLRVLDLGCGTGFPLFELAHVLGPTCRVWGADLWEQALRRAGAKAAVHELGNVALVRADGARLPFADASFDRIVSNVGVNNFEDPGAALAECRRTLRPGGLLALTTNVEGHYGELYRELRRVLIATGRTACLPALEAQEGHRGDAEGLVRLLRSAGLKPRRLESERHRYRFTDGSALLRHALTRFGFLDGWRRVIPEDEQRDVFAALEAALNDWAEHHGELRMTVPWLYLEAERPEG